MATEFKNGATSTQKVKILSHARTGEGTKLDKTAITYTRTDGVGNGAALTASKFTSDFTNEEKLLIKGAETGNDGGEVVLIKEFTQKEGADHGYWNLKTLAPISTFVEKPQKPAYKASYSKPSTTTATPARSGYNEAGVKAGAVLHDAVAVAIAVNGKSTTTVQVATIARELLALSTQLEEEVRNGNYNNTSTNSANSTNGSTNNVSKLSSVNKATVLDELKEFDSLDDLNSIDIDL